MSTRVPKHLRWRLQESLCWELSSAAAGLLLVKASLSALPSPSSQLCARVPHRAGRWASLLPGAGQSGCLSCSGTGRGHVLPGVRTGGHREPSRLRWSPLLIKLPDRAGLPAPLSALLDGVIAAATSQRVIVRTGETAPVKHVSHSARPLIAAQETLAVVMSATHRRAGALYLPSPRKCSRDSDPHPVSWGLGRRAGM